MTEIELLQKKIDDVRRDALNRLDAVKRLVEHVRDKVGDSRSYLNCLGDLQAEANMADCRVATLAVLNELMADCVREKEQKSP